MSDYQYIPRDYAFLVCPDCEKSCILHSGRIKCNDDNSIFYRTAKTGCYQPKYPKKSNLMPIDYAISL